MLGADGFILSDVARRAPGFGAGVEAALYCACSGPSLIVLDSDCESHSRFECGLAGDIRATVVPLGPADELAAVVAEWFATRYEGFLVAWRRRQNARLVHARRHEQLCALIMRASDRELLAACDRSGLSAAQLQLVIQSIEMMGAVPWAKLESLIRVLGSRTAVRRPARRDHRINTMALRQAGRQQNWSGREMATLLREAERELAKTGTDHRLILTTPAEWIALHERLNRAG